MGMSKEDETLRRYNERYSKVTERLSFSNVFLGNPFFVFGFWISAFIEVYYVVDIHFNFFPFRSGRNVIFPTLIYGDFIL